VFKSTEGGHLSQKTDNRVVKRGILLGIGLTLVIFPVCFNLIPQIDHEPGLLARLKLGIECAVFPGIFFLILIIRIGMQRYGNTAEDPTELLASSHAMEVDLRVLTNTHEQLLVFAINLSALSILLPFSYLTLLPIYSGTFILGRMMFWAGYRHQVLWRAPGFGLNMFPAALGLIYSAIAIFTAMD